MNFQPHPYAFFLGISALFSAGVAGLALMRRRSRGMRSLALTAAFLAFWGVCYALAWLTAGQTASHLWFYSMYLGVVGVPLSFLILVLVVTRHVHWLRGGRGYLLLVEPVLMLIAVWTNDLHHQFIQRFGTFQREGLVYLEVQRGPVYWTNVAYSYLVLLVCMFLLVRSLGRTALLFRGQLFAFILGAALPWLGNIATLAGLIPFRGLDVTPGIFGITAVIFFLALTSPLRVNPLPMARGLLLQVLTDGMLVLDMDFRFLDINPAAERLLGKQAREILGSDSLEVFPEWKELAPLLRARPEEISLQAPGRSINPSRHFDLKITPIKAGRIVTGYLVIFRDITDRWLVEQQMRQANLELQTRLTEIEALHQELRARAIRDPLTNLFNRRYLEETLEIELARAERDGNPVSVIMMDADKFKRINDEHGHKAGDLALQALARIIQLYIRKSDIACRYGGEEFVIVMPNTGIEIARDRAEKIREDFCRVEFIGPDTRGITSLSIGIAAYPVSGQRGEEVLDAADQAMYAAKLEGGNRIKMQNNPVQKTGIPVDPDASSAPKPAHEEGSE